MDDSEKSWRFELERMGHIEVRRAIDRGELWGEGRTGIARQWLSEKDHESDARKEASNRDNSQTARSVKNAAWVAAIAAIAANIIAIAAFVMSYIAWSRPHG